MEIIPSLSNCFTILCLSRICRLLPLKALFFAMAIADWQSQCMDTEGLGLVPNGMSDKKFLIHSASLPVIYRVTNSDSMVDLAIIVCLDDFQVTAPPPRMNIKPLVDFVSSELDIQFASLYPSNVAGNPLYKRP